MTYSSHHGPPSYLELFFCQKVQVLPPTGVDQMPWVVSGEDRGTCIETPYGEYQNTLHFSVSEAQPIGEIVIEAKAPGYLKLDASSGMRINTEMNWKVQGQAIPARVDDSIQRVENYVLVIPTPLNRNLGKSTYRFADHTKTWEYPVPLGFNQNYSNQIITHTLTVDSSRLRVDIYAITDALRSYRVGTVDLTKYYRLEAEGQGIPFVLNHWWTDNMDPHEPRTPSVNAKLFWRTLTVDSGQKRVSDFGYTYLPPDGKLQGKVSSETFFTEIETLEGRWYDTGWHGRVVTNINVTNVPSSPFEISYWVTEGENRHLVSRTTVPLPGRGWLPANHFGETMNTCELIPLAFGLFALVAKQRQGMLVDVLNELLYQWAVVYNNVVDGQLNPLGKGLLPDEFPRYGREAIKGNRTVYANAWLGMALCKAVEFLDREAEPPLLRLLLKQLALFVAYCVDTATGITFDGYSAEDFILDSNSLRSAAMAGIFLNEYLQVSYDPLVHNRLCRIQERLHQDQSVYEQWQSEEETNLNLIAYATYLEYYGGELYRMRAANILSRIHSRWQETGELPTGLCQWWYSYIITKGRYWERNSHLSQERWSVKNFLEPKGKDLASPLRQNPSLIASAWWVIADQEFNLFLTGRFETNFLEVNAYRDHCFLLMRAFWPFGYLTTNPDKERKQGGVIGSLLFALAEVNYHWFALYSLFRDGMDISKAQGWVLDAWGESYGLPRQGLETDYAYKLRLKREMKSPACTPTGLTQVLEDYFDKWRMEEGRPPAKYWIKEQRGNEEIFIEQTWKADIDQIERLPTKDGQVGVYLAPNEESFTPLHQFIPKVFIETPVIRKDGVAVAKKAIPSGVPLQLNLLVGREDLSVIDTVYYLQDISYAEIISNQDINSFELEYEFSTEIEDAGDTITYEPDIRNTTVIRLVYLPAQEQAWLEDTTHLVPVDWDRVILVPPGPEVDYGTYPVGGKIIVGARAIIHHHFGAQSITFYTRNGNLLRLEPTLGALLIP